MEQIAEKVRSIVLDSLSEDGEIIEGVVRSFGFDLDRLEAHRETVKEILEEMPEAFHKETGGGWSFLQLCQDKHGYQWGEHENMEELVCVAIALGLAAFQLPRPVWSALPGGMPYIVFTVDAP